MRQGSDVNTNSIQRYTKYLQTTTTATSLPPGGVGGDWSDILDPADPHAGTSESTEGALSTRAWGLGLGTSGSTELDVESGDTDLLASSGTVLSSQHGGVWRRLVSVGLDLHSTGDSDDGLLARQISDVDESVVERGDCSEEEIELDTNEDEQ